MKTRTEKDALGEKSLSASVYYGIQTLRAVENFPISGLRAQAPFVEATVQIKKAAARVNERLGLLDPEIGSAIVTAADEILEGGFRDQFVVDVYQAGAGTSHNMNVNEVIANRAIEILGGEKGDYAIVHPNDHVNMSQSTNDVIPTAMRLSTLEELNRLFLSVRRLASEIREKAGEFDHIIKAGRTHLQDAVPLRLGQEIGAWAANLEKHADAIAVSAENCRELGIGGTAVGTGLNAHPEYRQRMVQQLAMQLDTDLRMAGDYFEAMQSLRPFVAVSGAVRNLAQDLIRIANDLRLLGSGPTTGFAELHIPAVQPGSSIMPGKVNPVMAEMLAMVCFQVIGCDTTILFAAQAGQLELNVMMPVVAFNLLHEIEILTNAIEAFSRRCVAGLSANAARCKLYAEQSMSIMTVLNPIIGYARAAEIAKEWVASGQSMRELISKRTTLSQEQIDRILDLKGMTEPGIHE